MLQQHSFRSSFLVCLCAATLFYKLWCDQVHKTCYLRWQEKYIVLWQRYEVEENEELTRRPPDADSLHQHCLCANYLVCHPSLKCHQSQIGSLGADGWWLSPCPPHVTYPPNAFTCTRASWRVWGWWEHEEDEDDGAQMRRDDSLDALRIIIICIFLP